MKGWKTFVIFTIIGIMGLVTALEAVDVKSILLPLVCHVDPANFYADNCTEGVIKFAGIWTSIISVIALWLRAVTTSSIFKSLKE